MYGKATMGPIIVDGTQDRVLLWIVPVCEDAVKPEQDSDVSRDE